MTVMGTIPKTRLRVVNADMDRASLRSASDSALSRTESIKALRREESIRTLRTRSEGDKIIQGAIAEEERVGREGENMNIEQSEKEKAA